MIRLLAWLWVGGALLVGALVGAVGAGTAQTAAVSAGLQDQINQARARASLNECATNGKRELLAANAARAAGFPDTPAPEAPGYTHLEVAVAVAGQESGYDPREGNRLADGRTHRGLWQISSLHLSDPRINPGGAGASDKPVQLRGGAAAAGWKVDSHPVTATLDGTLLRHTGGGTWRSQLLEPARPPFTVTAKMRVTRMSGSNNLGGGNATDPGLKLILFTGGDWRSRGNYQMPVQTLRGETFVSRRPTNATPGDYTFADRGRRQARPGQWQDVRATVEPAGGGLRLTYWIDGQQVASRVDRSPLPGPFYVGVRSDGVDWEIDDFRLNGQRGQVGGDPRYDPAENARMAYRLWKIVGQKWHPTWSAFTDGGYRDYLDDARAAVRATAGAPACARGDAPTNDAGDQPRTAALRAAIQDRYGPVEIGGKRGKSRGRGHMNGHALDVMTHENRQLGWQVVAFVQTYAEQIGVEYVIFEQQIWYPGGTKWRRMEDRGGVTENHYDHPHIELLPG